MSARTQGTANNEWTTAKDPVSGDTYYYHRQTKQTSWTAPPGWVDPPAQAKQAPPQASSLQSSASQQSSAVQPNQAGSQPITTTGSVKAAAAVFGGSAPVSGARGQQAPNQQSTVLAQQPSSGYQAGQQNPTQQNFGYNQASQPKKLAAANPAAQQPALSAGQKVDAAAQLGQRQPSVNSGVASQLGGVAAPPLPGSYGAAAPNAVNQGYAQPQNPPLQGAQPQYPQQAPYGTIPPTSLAAQGAIGPQGYSVVSSGSVPQAQNAGGQPQNIGIQQPYGSVPNGQPPYGSVAGGYPSGYAAGAVATNAGISQNQVTANGMGQPGRAQAAATSVGTPPAKDIPPTKKLEVLKDVADPKLPEAQTKQILRDGGCKVALELELDASVAKRPDFKTKIKQEIASAISIQESQVQIDEVRAGSIKLGLTIKPSDQSRSTPSEAVNKLDALVKERQLGTHELLSRAKSCEVVFDAAKLKSMKEESEREFTKMRESMEKLAPLDNSLMPSQPAEDPAPKGGAASMALASSPVVIPPPASALSPQRLYACSLGTGFVGTFEEVQAHEQRILAAQASGWGTVVAPAHAPPATASAVPSHAAYQPTTIVAPAHTVYQPGLYGSQLGVPMHSAPMGPDYSMQVPQLGFPGHPGQHVFAGAPAAAHW